MTTAVGARLSDEARALVEAHLPLVREVLAGVAGHYPRHTDREELCQAAALGLVEAAARYDPARGVPFDRWAVLRIRGAIVDAARALDFAPRAVRAAARDLEAARAELEGRRGRSPTVHELAEALGLSVDEVVRLQGRVHRALVLSLDAPCGEEESGEVLTLAGGLVDDEQPQPFEVLEQQERVTSVREALAGLPPRLREVVISYFLDGTPSSQLAERLGVTRSRVSQLRTEALALLREGLQADDPAEVRVAG